MGFFGLLCMILAASVVAAEYSRFEGMHTKDISWFRFDGGAFVACSLMSVAFTMHYSGLQFFYELKDRSIRKMNSVMGVAFAVCWCMYAMAGVTGYMSFGPTVKGD